MHWSGRPARQALNVRVRNRLAVECLGNRSRALVLVVAAALLAGFTYCANLPDPAPRGPRLCAEWEPALGTLITWPLHIPEALVVELAEDDRLYVLVADEPAEAEARAAFGRLGVDLSRVECIRTSVQTCWTRDFGPHMVFDAAGRMTFVDPVYIDTPGVRADYVGDPQERPFTYWGSYPGDDRTNVEVAAHLGASLVPMQAYLTGGNFLVDGFGRAFSSRLMVDENLRIMEEADFHEQVEELTGVDDHVILADTEAFGIQHVDCWMKLLDPETLLVKRAPADHPEAAPIERNLVQLRGLRTPFGRPYRILRVDCPRYRGDHLPAYTNSLILNRKVLVPLFGQAEADAAALAVYRGALPGYEVIGFPFDGWQDFDALHCRTRAVFDPRMLRLSAPRVLERVEPREEVQVSVTVRDHGREGLAEGSVELHWRLAGAEDWTVLDLGRTSSPGVYAGLLPVQEPGASIEYRFIAAARGGREARLPMAGAWSFAVGE